MNLDFSKVPVWLKIATVLALFLNLVALIPQLWAMQDSVPLSDLGEFGKIDYGYRVLPTATVFILFSIYTLWNILSPIKQAKDIKAGKVVVTENGIASAVDHNFEAWLYIFVSEIATLLGLIIVVGNPILVVLLSAAFAISIRWGIFDIVLNLARGLKWNYVSDTSAGEEAKMSSVLWFMKNSKKDIPSSNVICVGISIALFIIALIIK